MADWSVEALLLRLIEFDLRGANWQRGGGKGNRPKVLELPDGKGGKAKAAGPDVAAKLRNLGLIPTGASGTPSTS
jgi:hypothetical protein